MVVWAYVIASHLWCYLC